MKKLISAIFVLTCILLLITNSMYIELTEINIIIFSTSSVSFIYNMFIKTNQKYSQIVISSAIIGFFLSWIFSLFDIVSDHYKLIQGVPDGRYLTLKETIAEFSNDLFIITFMIMCTVTIISFIGTIIFSKFFRKIT